MNYTATKTPCQVICKNKPVRKGTVADDLESGKKIGSKPRPMRGPIPKTLKIEGDWEEAVKESLKKKRPSKGWPK